MMTGSTKYFLAGTGIVFLWSVVYYGLLWWYWGDVGLQVGIAAFFLTWMLNAINTFMARVLARRWLQGSP